MLSTVRYQKKYRDYQNVKETILICNTIQRLGALVAVFTLVLAVSLRIANTSSGRLSGSRINCGSG